MMVLWVVSNAVQELVLTKRTATLGARPRACIVARFWLQLLMRLGDGASLSCAWGSSAHIGRASAANFYEAALADWFDLNVSHPEQRLI